MSDHSHVAKRSVLRRLRSTRVRAVLSLGIVLGFGAVGTMAYWTDSAALTGGTFTSGTLDVKLTGVENNPPAFATSLAMTNMQPGDSKAAVVTVQNVGPLAFNFIVNGYAAGTLGSLLSFKVVPGGAVTGSGTTMGCSGTSSWDAPIASSAPGSLVVDGSPAQLVPATTGTKTLCVAATLPAATLTGQGQSTTANFTVTAKQTAAP